MGHLNTVGSRRIFPFLSKFRFLSLTSTFRTSPSVSPLASVTTPILQSPRAMLSSFTITTFPTLTFSFSICNFCLTIIACRYSLFHAFQNSPIAVTPSIDFFRTCLLCGISLVVVLWPFCLSWWEADLVLWCYPRGCWWMLPSMTGCWRCWLLLWRQSTEFSYSSDSCVWGPSHLKPLLLIISFVWSLLPDG